MPNKFSNMLNLIAGVNSALVKPATKLHVIKRPQKKKILNMIKRFLYCVNKHLYSEHDINISRRVFKAYLLTLETSIQIQNSNN